MSCSPAAVAFAMCRSRRFSVQRQPDPTLDDYLEIHVNKAGDFSNYTISVVNAVNGQPTNEPMDGFDPRYSQVCFSFKASCPTDLDCKQPCTCPPPQRTQPDIDYLAKDYESFRQLILDRMALIMPAVDRDPRARPRHHAGRVTGLCRRLPELLPGCGRDRSLSRNRAPAYLGAAARASGGLSDARWLQRARLAHHLDRHRPDVSIPLRFTSSLPIPARP